MNTVSPEIAEKICGADASKYLIKKHRGGRAGGDGVLFEIWYAVYRAAVLIKELIVDGKASSLPVLATQSFDYVDDLTISWEQASKKHHFQLKNSGGVSWNSGDHPIAEDFRLQKQLNDGLGIASTVTTLVTSDYRAVDKLSDSTPSDIASFSGVEGFAFAETLNHMLQVEPRLHDALSNLCATADLDKVEKLGTVLVGAWVTRAGTPSGLGELWEAVLAHEPNYIRFTPETDVVEKFDQILMQIEGFSYTIADGYFEWAYLDMDSGMLEYPVDSDKFDEFQSVIIKEEPSTFEDLERHLI